MKSNIFICNVCQEEKELCNSHIIPEFFYKTIYDEGVLHRYKEISTIKIINNIPKQKGIREHLLCKKCEEIFSRNEDYARKVLYGGVRIKVEEERHGFVLSEINYEKFKLFQLSLLWRASVSKLPEFQEISLGPHQERIRKMLLANNPGKYYEYGCILIANSNNQDILQKLILMPSEVKKKFDGHRCYRFFLGGTFWIFFVSNHTNELFYSKYFLQEVGRLTVIFENNKTSSFLNAYFSDLFKPH